MSTLNNFGAALMGLGGVLAIWVLNSARRRWALLRHPVRVKGEVIRIRQVESTSDHSTSRRDSRKLYPTVRYQSEDGQTVERELPPSGEPNKWKVGNVIRLIHERGNPKNVVDEELRWGDLVASALGTLIVLGIGVLLCFFVKGTSTR